MSKDIPITLNRYKQDFDNYLTDLFEGKDHELYSMMRHQLGWEGNKLSVPGKYVRPSLMLLAVEICDGEPSLALPAAVGLELLHNFSLIHDDIQDESILRRGRETVWRKWNPSQAINAGDGMYALSRLILFEMEELGVSAERIFHAGKLLDQTCLSLCEGQYTDLQFQDQSEVTLSEYQLMIKNKTASAFRCAFEMGAVIAEGRSVRSEIFGSIGIELGLAYQIIDDVLDIWGGVETGKQIAIDLQQGKKSLPIVYGLNHHDSRQSEILRDFYNNDLQESNIAEVVSLLNSIGAREFCMDQAELHWDKAVKLVNDLEVSKENRDVFFLTGEYLLNRVS